MPNSLLVPIAVGLFIFGGAATAAQSPATGDFAGLVDVGGGRKMYLECRGAGSPTVVLVAGLKASARDWNSTRGSGADGLLRRRQCHAGLRL